MNLLAQPLKASPHVLRPRVGVRLLRLTPAKAGSAQSDYPEYFSMSAPGLSGLFVLYFRDISDYLPLNGLFKHSDRAGSTQGKGWVKQ